ncbi:hypothetical protein HBH98_211190 [Parastagonospora nodorum]|nr:hypothetical protein HBH48_208320 [Parastagonospora nodorum]KAH4338978.1 hypothetical protein HBH98_211190 [Parastagonospora nodorum]KAH4529125.1 hypothetical protein HBH85_197250 [Parastagonospora nodorum]KAH4536952.1 hypothetical protein HBH86_191340 [Parastagonospora nodorum]KAH4558387.1 hypothetical protein HBH84_214490 [Parastagonospora nodorum]
MDIGSRCRHQLSLFCRQRSNSATSMKNLTLATKRYAPVMQHPGDVHQSATATPLLHLPNELLLQVASYLAATPHIQEIARKDFKFERSFTSSSSQTLLNHLGYCRKHPPQPPVSRTVKKYCIKTSYYLSAA